MYYTWIITKPQSVFTLMKLLTVFLTNCNQDGVCHNDFSSNTMKLMIWYTTGAITTGVNNSHMSDLYCHWHAQ